MNFDYAVNYLSILHQIFAVFYGTSLHLVPFCTILPGSIALYGTMPLCYGKTVKLLYKDVQNFLSHRNRRLSKGDKVQRLQYCYTKCEHYIILPCWHQSAPIICGIILSGYTIPFCNNKIGDLCSLEISSPRSNWDDNLKCWRGHPTTTAHIIRIQFRLIITLYMDFMEGSEV